jgi:hypothetical protein
MQIPSVTPVVVPPTRGVAPHVDVRPLDPQPSGTLKLGSPDRSGRDFMSAASGIAAGPGHTAWSVSDEYGELGRFTDVQRPGELLPGIPPAEKKPDLESIVLVPAKGDTAAGTLLALGSGSSKTRNRGLLQDVDATGAALGAATIVDLTKLYKQLEEQLPVGVNIEGAAFREGTHGAELLLFHRGQIEGDHNEVFTLDAKAVLKAARAGKPVPGSVVLDHKRIDLGTLGGSPLGFSDARELPDGRIAFLASSEGEGDGPDGAIKGSVLGMLDADLTVTELHPLSGPARKAEGIELASQLDASAPANRFVLVTDPDDPVKPTELLTVDV